MLFLDGLDATMLYEPNFFHVINQCKYKGALENAGQMSE